MTVRISKLALLVIPALVALIASPAAGQNKPYNEEITVIAAFDPIIPDAFKLNQNPVIDDTTTRAARRMRPPSGHRGTSDRAGTSLDCAVGVSARARAWTSEDPGRIRHRTEANATRDEPPSPAGRLRRTG